MAVRRSMECVVLGGLFLLLAVGLERPVAAEESEKAKSLDPERLLEGLAPLAKHGGFTLKKTDDHSPKPEEPPPDLPAAHRKDYRKGLERLTKHEWSTESEPKDEGPVFATPEPPRRDRDTNDDEVTWSRHINLAVLQFQTERDATAFRKAVRAWASSSESASSESVQVLNGVRPVVVCDGTVKGFAFLGVHDVQIALFSLDVHLVQRGRTVLRVTTSQCEHISPETTQAFIEYAFRRLEDPAAKPPPSPRVVSASRDLALSVETPGRGPVGSLDVMWRRAGGNFGKIRRVGPPWKLTLPKAVVQLRIGQARSRAGAPIMVLGTDVLVGPTQPKAVAKLPTAGTMRVRVLGAGRRPIHGATVQTISRPLKRFNFGIVVMGEEQPSPDIAIPEEVGDGQGQTDRAGWVTLPVDPGRKTLVVVRKGERFLPNQTWALAGAPIRTVVLKPGWVFRAHFTDRTGRPVACDPVAVLQISGGQRHLETGDDGKLRLGPIPREAISMQIYPRTGWYGRLPWRRIEPTDDVVHLTLPCDQIDLRVVGPDGKDVPRCWVEMRRSDGMEGGGFTLHGATRVTVPTFAYTLEVLEATDDDERPLNLRRARVAVEPGTKQVTLRMEEGRKIDGLLLDPDGKPVAGAEIRAQVGAATVGRATTDKEGIFKIIGLEDRPVMLVVDSPAPLSPTRAPNVDPTEGGEYVELRLPEAVPITIVDEHGRPVRLAYVVLLSGSGSLYFETHTDETGLVYFPDFGSNHVIRVQMQNGEPLAEERRVWDGKPITIRMRRAFTAKILVVDAEGPAVNAHVEVEDYKPDYWEETGPEGRLTYRYIPVGTKRARARRQEGEPWSAWVPLYEAPRVTKITLPNAKR